MTLDEYLSLHGETAQKFARRVKRATSTITRLRNLETKPDWPTATAILLATKGKVTPNDFLDVKVKP
jgi:hypothetical protein